MKLAVVYKACKVCGELFAARGSTKTCSPKCRKLNNDAIRTRTQRRLAQRQRNCVVCGVVFKPETGGICCSEKCKKERSRTRGREWARRNKEAIRQRYADEHSRTCAQCRECGTEFNPKSAYDVFCSDACRTARRIRKSRASCRRKWEDRRLQQTRLCVVCGTAFCPRHGKTVCSPECDDTLKRKGDRRRGQRLHAKQRELRKSMPLPLKIYRCIVCGTHFATHGWSQTCGPECVKRSVDRAKTKYADRIKSEDAEIELFNLQIQIGEKLKHE